MKWLHLSDLHYNPERDGRNTGQLRKELLTFLKDKKFSVDEIFITGDFRHALHQKDELSSLAKDVVSYIMEVAKCVGITSSKKIHILPGNHDLTRSNSAKLKQIIENYDPMKGIFTNDELDYLSNRFDFFYFVCQELYGNDLIYNRFRTELHPYFLVGNCVVLCMNTAITCGFENERGNLVIGNDLLYRSFEKIKNEYPEKKIIVLAHHAIEYLSKTEREQVEKIFTNNEIDLYLCGDAHEIWIRKINNWLEITTGCLVNEKDVEVVFCMGNTNKNEIKAYEWNQKFGTWQEYIAFNNYLDTIMKNRPQSANLNNLPKLERNYRITDDIIFCANQILEKNRFIYISGLSGIGKTCLSIKLSEQIKNKFQISSVYFIDGSHIENFQDFYAIDLDKSGRMVNLIDTITIENAVYIIDDLQRNIDNIVENLVSKISTNKNSFIIITSQLESAYASHQRLEYVLSFLTDEKNILDIINVYLPKEKQCPENLISVIKEKTNGHPLLLNSLRALVQYDNENWEDILEGDLVDFVYHEVEDGRMLLTKVLNRHKETLSRELAAIGWLNTKYISEPLLSKLITKEGIRKLSKRFFIQKSEDNGTIKIHDIIFECIIEFLRLEPITGAYSDNFKKNFYAYFIKELNNKSAKYFKALHLHEKKIYDLANKEKKLGVEWYFYAKAFPNDDYEIFSQFKYTEEECISWIKESKSQYIIGTLLELMERNSRIKRKSSSYQQEMNEQINILNILIEKIKLGQDLRFMILHYLGKLYRNIDKTENALECFKQILENRPNHFESKLQLIRIQKNTKSVKPEVIANEYAELLDNYIKGEKISMSIVLAAYSDLYSIANNSKVKKKYFLDRFEYFNKAIHSMAVETFDQPYKVLALTIKFYTYNYPQKIVQLVNNLPIPALNTINKNNYFDIAQLYKEIGKAIMWAEETIQLGASSKYFNSAEEFYYHVVIDDSYKCVQRAENLILLKKYNDAKDFLNEFKFENNAFWNYRYGQTLVGTGEVGKREAIQYIERAIELCNQDVFLPSFYHLLANTYAEINKDEAKRCYEKALNFCGNNNKYKNQIQEDMNFYLK